jgi:hypothetical protein
MINSNIRNEAKKLAQTIETLAKEVQVQLDGGNDPIMVANEMVRNNSTFVFVLGELYAMEQQGKQVKNRAPRDPNAPPRNYHSKRDRIGRFTK